MTDPSILSHAARVLATFSSELPADAARNVEFVLECTAHRPRWAVILGSGFACVADRLERWAAFPYQMFE